MRLHLPRFAALAAAATGLAVASLPSVPARANMGVGTPNMSHVANLQYPTRAYPSSYAATLANQGTDLETTTLTVDGVERDYVVAGSYRNGLQLIDVTDPANPTLTQTFDCGIAQGDVQIIKRGGRTFAAYAVDDISDDALFNSQCYRDAWALRGLEVPPTAGDARVVKDRYGTFIIDITNPHISEGTDRVRVVGWASWANGSHNVTVSPDGMYLYNSNQDLVARTPVRGQSLFQIEVFSLADLTEPVKVSTVPLNTGLGPHDITFSADGKRAYVAALTHTVVLNTETPAQPYVIGTIVDPAISIHHQADPIDLDGRRYLVVSDETAGVIEGAVACPGGGLHVYDITGALEASPVKVGAFYIPETSPALQTHRRCSSHVFKFYPEQKKMTIAWYGAGVRVLDASGLAGVSAGVSPVAGSVGKGIREVGSYYFTQTDSDTLDGSQTWAAKVHRFDADGSAYIFASDLDRGFDVYRYDATAPEAMDAGTWVDGTLAKLPAPPAPPAAPEAPAATAASGASARQLPYCVLAGRV